MTDSEQKEMDALRAELVLTKAKRETAEHELERARAMYNHLASEVIAPDMLKRYCDNARAYGWECGKQGLFGRLLPAVINSTEDNPFVNPDWDDHIKAQQAGFMLSAGEVPL